MPHLFRSLEGREYKPSVPFPLTFADGTRVEGIWGGSAQGEKLAWWLGKAGNELAQTEEVAAIAIRDEETKEVRWGRAPAGARLFFVLEPSPPGKDYRIAKMVTTAATPAQAAYFNEERFSLFGRFRADGTIEVIPPLPPPPPDPPQQPELF